jgi:hypothetical protein
LTPISRIKEIERIQFKEETMRVATIIALFAVMLAGTAFAGDNGNGCKLQGTWYGAMPGAGSFVVQYYGTGDNTGTDDTEWIKIDDALIAMGFARASHSRGVWTKTGPNTYTSVLLTFYYDAAGQIIWIGRSHGVKKLTDCNTMEYRGTFTEVLNPDMSVAYCYPNDPNVVSDVHRMVLEDCCP